MARALREVVFSAVLALALFVGINSVTARSYVDGPSMEPTLHAGQLLFVSRLGVSGLTREVYAAAHQEISSDNGGWIPPRGSIATFVHPNDPSRILVKRVIGLPGEEVAIKNGAVYIDGHLLDEPYVVYNDARSISPLVIPADSVLLLGDNRPASSDSRSFGPVPRANLLGVVMFRYWPLSELHWLLGAP